MQGIVICMAYAHAYVDTSCTDVYSCIIYKFKIQMYVVVVYRVPHSQQHTPQKSSKPATAEPPPNLVPPSKKKKVL